MGKETSSSSHFCLALIYGFKFQSNRVFKTCRVRKHVNRNRFMACWYGGGGRFFLRQSFEKVKGYFTRIYGHYYYYYYYYYYYFVAVVIVCFCFVLSEGKSFC